MSQKLLLIQVLLLLAYTANAQTRDLVVKDIRQHAIQFSWNDIAEQEVVLTYGLTKSLELGKAEGLLLENLSPATFYYVKASTDKGEKRQETTAKLFSTASLSPGDITVYFNQWVDNTASSIANAIHISAFEDTLVAYINRAQNTLDICNYNTGSLPIVQAINNAKTSGIAVRYIAADNTLTNNNELPNLSPTIPMIQRSGDGEVMHNKFLIIDAEMTTLAKVITGSVNHTDNSCHQDYNNLMIIEDQALALAYKIEFEEMWGSTNNTPNLANAKFGHAKTDNTPHDFNIGGTPVELYFSPSDGTTSHIKNAILSANTDIQIAMFTFINNDLGDAVITAHESGVDTKVIIENTLYWGSEYNSLQNAGIDVHSHFLTAHAFHHKYGIIDANNVTSDPLVITGSHNWTNSAEEDYDENTLIIHNAEIANMYYEEFAARYAEVTGTVGIPTFEMEQVSVYPNPTNDVLYLQAVSKIDVITISNAVGRQIVTIHGLQSTYHEYNISLLPNGVYFFSIRTQTGTTLHKVVKY